VPEIHASFPLPTSATDPSFTDGLSSLQFSWDALWVGFVALLPYFPLAIAGTVVWGLWLYRVILSARVKPIESDFRTTTSVVVPSFHEDPDILLRCLTSWRAQQPTEIIVVLDVADTDAYERIMALGDPTVRPILFHHAGKRSALGAGIREAQGELLILTDSDTSWTPGLLENVQKPFVDPAVGGVSTQQNVYQRTTSIWRRVADWLVNLRYYNYVPAMGHAGAVPCISGRTAVYRRSAVTPVLEHLENEFFLGRRCISGDDGRLTWLVLAAGYKTVHQRSARALSMFPSSFSAFVKQRVRWSRNSYRCYLTAVAKGWLWRVPFVTKITVLQILLTPVTMGLTVGYLLFSRLELTAIGIWAAVIWLLLGRGVRGISHLRRHPLEIFLLPIVTVTVILIALPIKVYAFTTMNKQGWLTRHADQIGGDGQTAATLHEPAPAQAQPQPQAVAA
jgi:cellulose synthase/poly-beta-1,6-N-acetylglucosamine synthase-like glycosyltransferase